VYKNNIRVGRNDMNFGAVMLLLIVPALSSMIYELIPAFDISFVLVFMVSLFTKPPEGAEKELAEITAKY